MSKANNGANLGFERELWQAADAIIGFLYRAHCKDITRQESFPMNAMVIRNLTTWSTNRVSRYLSSFYRLVFPVTCCAIWI